MQDDIISFDTETTLIQRWEPVPRLVVTAWAMDTDEGLVHVNDSDALPTAQAILDNESVQANGPFDFAVWMRKWPQLIPHIFKAIEQGTTHDVLVREKLLDIARGAYKFLRGKGQGRGYSLEAVAYRGLHVELDKSSGSPRLKYGELLDVPVSRWTNEQREYPLQDVRTPLAILRRQEDKRAAYQKADEVDVFADECRQLRAKWALHLTSTWGICVDQQAVTKFETEVERRYQLLGAELLKAGLVVRGPEGDTFVKKIEPAREKMVELCERAGIEVEYTPLRPGGSGGNVKLARSIVASACALTQDHLLNKFVNFNSLQKLKGTYIRHLKSAGRFPVHAFFDELVDTGRTSAARPNLQNPPRRFLGDDGNPIPGVRECYVPRPGHAFVLCDYDKAELVSFSEVAFRLFGRSALGEALIENVDPHTRVAAQIAGCSYEEAVRRIEAHDPVMLNYRNCAKPANFGFLGGLGAERFVGYAKASYNVDVTLDFAKALRADWRKTWPEVNDYLDYVSGLTCCPDCHGTRKAVTLDGDELPCPKCSGHGSTLIAVMALGSNRLRGRVKFTEVANGFFQMLTADAAKHAHWCVTKRQHLEPSSALYGTHVVNFVHDELIVEAPISRARAVAKELEETMIDAYREWVPNMANAVRATARIEDRWRK